MIFERVVRYGTTRFVLWLLSGGGLRAVYYSKHQGDREEDAFYGEPLGAEGAKATLGEDGHDAGDGIKAPQHTQEHEAVTHIANKHIYYADEQGEPDTAIYSSYGTEGIGVAEMHMHEVHNGLRVGECHEAY